MKRLLVAIVCLLALGSGAHAENWYGVLRGSDGKCVTLENLVGVSTPAEFVNGFRHYGYRVEDHSQQPVDDLAEYIITTPKGETKGFVLVKGKELCDIWAEMLKTTGEMPYKTRESIGSIRK